MYRWVSPCFENACRATELMSTAAPDAIGARALIVHVKDDQAKSFYEHFINGYAPARFRVVMAALTNDLKPAIEVQRRAMNSNGTV